MLAFLFLVLAAESSTDWIALADRWGFPAIFVTLFLAGIITTGRAFERERADRLAAEAREQALRDKLDDRIIPLLTELTRELAESTAARKDHR